MAIRNKTSRLTKVPNVYHKVSEEDRNRQAEADGEKLRMPPSQTMIYREQRNAETRENTFLQVRGHQSIMQNQMASSENIYK